MEKEPFRIHDKCNGMYRVTVVDTGEYTVRDLKLALEATHGVPLAESVLIADGGAMPDEARLSDFVVGTSWVVMIHRPLVVEAEAAAEQQEASHGAAGPEEAVANNGNDAGDGGVEVIPHRAQSAPVTPGGTLKATFSFFYRGDVKNLSIKSADSIGSVLENVVAPAFGVESPERLGLYVECCLLPRDSLVEDSLQLLRSCAIIPVVNDLVTMRVRDQNMPADAFRTDCDVCMTTGVNSKLRPFCSKCNEGCIVDVQPSFLDIRKHQTRFPWRFLESLTGTCLNEKCKGHETVVEVYFNCVCSAKRDDGSACNALLASYKGGRVEALLEELYRNQYFVRVDQDALAVAAAAAAAANEEKLDVEALAH